MKYQIETAEKCIVEKQTSFHHFMLHIISCVVYTFIEPNLVYLIRLSQKKQIFVFCICFDFDSITEMHLWIMAPVEANRPATEYRTFSITQFSISMLELFLLLHRYIHGLGIYALQTPSTPHKQPFPSLSAKTDAFLIRRA